MPSVLVEKYLRPWRAKVHHIARSLSHSINNANRYTLLSIEDLSKETQDISLKYFFLTLGTSILTTFSSTFLFLFVIDELEIVSVGKGVELFGTIILIQFIVSAVTDFPTGVLADWLGHKWVLAVAYILFGIGYSILSFADTFQLFMVSFIIIALANGQASGALQSWFDNNYKIVGAEDDPNREIYKEFLGKANMYFQFGGAIFFLIGGIMATRIGTGRILVFQIQAVGMFVLAAAFILKLHGVKKKQSTSEESYFSILFAGVRFVYSSKVMFFYMLSQVAFLAVGLVWFSLVLFPLYFGYTGSDELAGTLRWLAWIGGAMSFGYLGKLSKNLDEKKWMPRVSLLGYTSFFGLSAIVVYFIDIQNSFNYIGMTLILLIFVFSGVLFNLNVLLTQKFFLEVVPDEMRNSIYSLLPTLGLLVGAGLAPLMAAVIKSQSMAFTIGVFTILGLVSVFFEFISLSNYQPTGREEVADEALELYSPVLYDSYSIHNYEASTYHIPRQWQMSSKIKLLWDKLIGIAMADGKISEEERNILHSIMVNLKNYANIMEQAMSDGEISSSESDLLFAARRKLITDVEAVAMEDLDITIDEHRLINKLIKILLHLSDEQLSDQLKILDFSGL